MATQTTYYELTKPAASEGIDVEGYNGDLDILDSALHAIQETLDTAVLTTEQSLGAQLQAQARANIGAVGTSEAVLVASQSLQPAQQAQARTNIGAVAGTEVVLLASQSLQDAQKAQARTNIGAISAAELAAEVANVVRVSEQTGFSDAQKTQARTNIGAAGSAEVTAAVAAAVADVVRVSEQTGFSEAQKTQARTNIGAIGQAEFDNRNQNLWQVVDFQLADEATLAASSVATYTGTPSDITGYTLVGIVGTTMDGSNTSFIFMRNAFVNSYGEVKATCRNTGGSSATVTLYAKLLYIKN